MSKDKGKFLRGNAYFQLKKKQNKKTSKYETENPKRRQCRQCLFDFRMKKQTNVSKRQINLYKNLENVSRSLLEPIQISMMELLLQK